MQGLFQIEWLIKNCMFLLNNALQSIYWGYLNSKQIINQLSVLRPIVLQFNLVWIQCPNYQLISKMYYDAIFLNHNNSNNQQLTSKSDPFYLFPAWRQLFWIQSLKHACQGMCMTNGLFLPKDKKKDIE